MLSVGSRDDGRKGIGLGLGFGGVGGDMEENELEEGEACSGQEDDASMDPDIDLSYIDEKIQNVLGHFQKDFEGVVCADNLGAKFGAYGSFLPAHQRSPSILSQPRSPPKMTGSSRSPYNSLFEGARQKTNIPTNAPIPSKNNSVPTANQSDISDKRDICRSAPSAWDSSPQNDLINKPASCYDQKTLKVRVKVGSENTLARNNAAIYSGLGLDISPSPSLEDSPDCSRGSSPEYNDSPDDSPMSTFHFYTCIPVPPILLSPIPENLLRMMERERPYPKDSKLGSRMVSQGSLVLSEETPTRNLKSSQENSTKIFEKSSRSLEPKKSNSKEVDNDISAILKKEIDIETPAGRELVSNALNIPLLSSSKTVDDDAERKLLNETVKGAGISWGPDRTVAKDRIQSPDFVNEEQLESTGRVDAKSGSGAVDAKSGSGATHFKTKLSLKHSAAEKPTERRTNALKDEALNEPRQDGKGNIDKSSTSIRADSEGYKGRKDHVVGPAESVKLKAPQRPISYEQDGEMILHGKDNSSGGKRKSKGSIMNDAASGEFVKDNSSAAASVVSKEKKKSLHSKGDLSGSKTNSLKSHKDSSRNAARECNRNGVGLVKVEQADVGADASQNFSRDKPKDLMLEYEKDDMLSAEKTKDKPGSKKVQNVPAPEAHDKEYNFSGAIPLIGSCPTSDAVPPPSVHVVIEENWVCCDRCQRWRLLPYGTNPDHLPKKWLCSMLNWLPGMNRCNISEEETTKALHALYQPHASEGLVGLNGHRDVSNSGMGVADPWNHRQNHDSVQHIVPGAAKKKPLLKDALNNSNPFAQIQPINPGRENQQFTFQNKSSDMNQHSLEPDLQNTSSLLHISKSTDFFAEKQNKQKEKNKTSERYSDGGDFFEQSGKPSKSKKREFDQDALRASKKLKPQEALYADEDSLSNHDLGGKTAPNTANGIPAKTTAKNKLKYKDGSTSKDSKSDSKDNSQASGKQLRAPIHITSNGEVKEHFSSLDLEKSDGAKKRRAKDLDSEKSDNAKKRRVKEWQESRVSVGADDNEETSETEARKGKKVRVSKSEGKEFATSKMNGRAIKNHKSTKIVLPYGRDHMLDGVENRGYPDMERQLKQRNMDCIDPTKRDVACAQPPTAATSSSSKVSSSRKANFQETRGSPVESVSSSPMRISNSVMVTTRKNLIGKDDSVNIGYNIMSSPRRSDGEADGAYDRLGAKQKGKAATSINNGSLDSNRAAVYSILDPMRGASNLQVREPDHLYASKDKTLLLSKIFGGMEDEQPSPSENEIRADGAAITPEQPSKYISGVCGQDNGLGQEKPDYHYQNNGSNGQRKSGKSSSSRSRERHKSSKTDKGKMKLSDSFSDQEDLHPTKNDNRFRYETAMDSHGRSINHEDFKDDKPNIPEKKDQKNYLAKFAGNWSSEGKRESFSMSGVQENMEVNGSTLLVNKHNNSRVAENPVISGNGCKPHFQESPQTAPSREEKSSNRLAERIDKSEVGHGRGRLETLPHSNDKQDSQNRASRSVPVPVKGGASNVVSVKVANGDVEKVPKHPRKLENQNGTHHSSSQHLTPNRFDGPGPIRKEGGQSAANVLKEARDLKHKANRLKNDGLEHESTGLYFQAALKFLHVALLREPSNSDSAKHGDMTPAIQMYSETAKLCEFIAHEYEKCKEMAAAALAYKCMEVAYMKVVYSKHASASKDRHELQIAPQTALHGESPSSSASDIDNLNNHGMVDKVASAKGVNSPQIAGNHVIPARNRPNFVRLLSFAEDVNFAMEASKKSISAFAAASVSLQDAQGDEVISSVRRVLDFSFHDIEGLLRLVRLSMECVSC